MIIPLFQETFQFFSFFHEVSPFSLIFSRIPILPCFPADFPTFFASAALSAPLPSSSSSRATRPLAQKAPRRKLKQVPSLEDFGHRNHTCIYIYIIIIMYVYMFLNHFFQMDGWWWSMMVDDGEWWWMIVNDAYVYIYIYIFKIYNIYREYIYIYTHMLQSNSILFYFI